MAQKTFTLHVRLWRSYRGLPKLVRIWIALAACGVLVEFVVLSGSGEEQSVRAAVGAAVRAATGPEPASSCSSFSPAGLRSVLGEFGEGAASSTPFDALAACRQLVPRLIAQATPQQLEDVAHGSVRSVQFRPGGSALVVYLSADRRLGAELTMSDHAGRWLIDGVSGGQVAGSQ